jgi:hypothetical protein
MYAFTGHHICFVAGHLKYKRYVCMPGAAHLQHPVNAYKAVLYNTWSFYPREQVRRNGFWISQFHHCGNITNFAIKRASEFNADSSVPALKKKLMPL